jgi:hypothetical protein
MSAAAENANSHRYFDEKLTFRTLYELLFRASKSIILSQHIRDCAIEHGLPWGDNGYAIQTSLGQSPTQVRGIPDIYMIIDIFWKNIRTGHITFHLVPNSIAPYTSNSRLHVKVEKSNRRTRRIRVTPVAGDLLFSLGSTVVRGCNIDDNLKPICDCIFIVLNKYFTTTNPDPISLENPRTPDYSHRELISYIETIARFNPDLRRSRQRGGYVERGMCDRDDIQLLSHVCPIRVYPTTRKQRERV